MIRIISLLAFPQYFIYRRRKCVYKFIRIKMCLLTEFKTLDAIYHSMAERIACETSTLCRM